MSKENNLTDYLTDLADAIREKHGGGVLSEKINPQDFSTLIRALPVLGDECDCLIFFNNTDPASKYGGTWQELTQGTFLMAAGSGGTAGVTDTHGNPNGMHTMTVEELASHSHHQQYSQDATMGYFNTIKATTAANNAPLTASYDDTTLTGGSKPFDIRPPTITAHIWRKVS